MVSYILDETMKDMPILDETNKIYISFFMYGFAIGQEELVSTCLTPLVFKGML